MNARRNISMVLMAALIFGAASSATATLIPRIDFEPIGSAMVDVEDLDLFALVMEGDPGQVIIEFHNENLITSSVESIHFEDNGFDGIDDLQSTDGIIFVKDISFVDFPSGEEVDPHFDTAFSISATSPPVWHGIRNDGKLTVVVDLDYGASYSNIVSGLSDGSIRIGMHVIRFGDSSFSVVNEVPEPTTIALFGFGSMILMKRSKSRKNRN